MKKTVKGLYRTKRTMRTRTILAKNVTLRNWFSFYRPTVLNKSDIKAILKYLMTMLLIDYLVNIHFSILDQE